MGQRVVIDPGCGWKKKAGAIGVDIARVADVDILADAGRTLPFRDSSVDEVVASHLVEHVDDLMAVMGEIWRICRPNALVYLRFPHGTTPYVIWKDPTHRRGVMLCTFDYFDYFDPETFDGKAFGYYHPAKFRIVRRRLNFNMNADTWVPSRMRVAVGAIEDRIANRNERAQHFCERFWGPFVGIEKAHIWMRAIKVEAEG